MKIIIWICILKGSLWLKFEGSRMDDWEAGKVQKGLLYYRGLWWG